MESLRTTRSLLASAQYHRSRILQQVHAREMILPALPDVMMRVRTAVADPNCSQARLAELVAADPQLSARLLKVANAAARFRGQPLSSLKAAVARLGQQRISMLVTSLALMQLMLGNQTSAHKNLLQQYGRRSQAVGASAYSLADYAGLDPERALLAGIVHAIGVLPILRYAQQADLGAGLPLPELVERLYPEVGAAVLRSWQFAPELVAVAAEHPQLSRGFADRPDYVDLVTAALIDYYRDGGHSHYSVAPERVSACRRLGLCPEPGLDRERLLRPTGEARAMLA
jgi:HD-like signal output (HDOD) protein